MSGVVDVLKIGKPPWGPECSMIHGVMVRSDGGLWESCCMKSRAVHPDFSPPEAQMRGTVYMDDLWSPSGSSSDPGFARSCLILRDRRARVDGHASARSGAWKAGHVEPRAHIELGFEPSPGRRDCAVHAGPEMPRAGPQAVQSGEMGSTTLRPHIAHQSTTLPCQSPLRRPRFWSKSR